ncbi:unnamed protein product, partial [Rhizoctonia solani]
MEPFLEPNHPRAPLLFQQEIANGKHLGHTTAGLLFSERLRYERKILECAQAHIYGNPVSPPGPFPPKSPTLRRRPTSVSLTNELNETRNRIDDLQRAYAALESDSSEQVSQLEKSNRELESEKEELRAEFDTLKDTLDEIQMKGAQERVETRGCFTQTEPLPEAKPTRE